MNDFPSFFFPLLQFARWRCRKIGELDFLSRMSSSSASAQLSLSLLGCLQTDPSAPPAAPCSVPPPLSSASGSAMGHNDDSDVIEQHVEAETENAEKQRCPSLLDSVGPSGEAHSGTQSSHRLLAYSDALISIIATVMVRTGGCSFVHHERTATRFIT